MLRLAVHMKYDKVTGKIMKKERLSHLCTAEQSWCEVGVNVRLWVSASCRSCWTQSSERCGKFLKLFDRQTSSSRGVYRPLKSGKRQKNLLLLAGKTFVRLFSSLVKCQVVLVMWLFLYFTLMQARV